MIPWPWFFGGVGLGTVGTLYLSDNAKQAAVLGMLALFAWKVAR